MVCYDFNPSSPVAQLVEHVAVKVSSPTRQREGEKRAKSGKPYRKVGGNPELGPYKPECRDYTPAIPLG